MCADEILGCTRFDTQEVAIVPLALHLLTVVLVGGQLEHHFLTEDCNGLQDLVSGHILVARTSIGPDSVPTNHISCP